MLDSYPAGTDFQDRVARIETGPRSIAIIDWGDGLSAPKAADNGGTEDKGDGVLARLADAAIYRLSGHKGRYSLADIYRMRTPNLPVFYSPGERNVRWLGGNFTHDFVVLPPDSRLGGGAPDLHSQIFENVFDDAVDLDTVRDDKRAIARMVERGIVSRDLLKPAVITLKDIAITPEERVFLKEVNNLLTHPAVSAAVIKNLFVKAHWIRAIYFRVASGEMQVAIGLLDRNGKVADPQTHHRRRSLRIGVDRDHPVIRHLVASSNPHRAYFALTYIGHELPKAQQQLIPYSPGFHFAKRMLSADIRRGLIESLLPAGGRNGANESAALTSADCS